MPEIDHEKMVRECWNEITVDGDSDGSCYLTAGFDVDERMRGIQIVRGTEAAAWQAAYDYTMERKRMIARRQEAVDLLHHYWDDQGENYVGKLFFEIYEREQAALAEMKRGMKGE